MNVLEGSLQLGDTCLDIGTHLPQSLHKVGDLRWRDTVFEHCSDEFQGFLISGNRGRPQSSFIHSLCHLCKRTESHLERLAQLLDSSLTEIARGLLEIVRALCGAYFLSSFLNPRSLVLDNNTFNIP